jgi:hypothetical protein
VQSVSQNVQHEHGSNIQCRGTGSACHILRLTTQLSGFLSELLHEGICTLCDPVRAGVLASFGFWPVSVWTGSRPICENSKILSGSEPDRLCYRPGSSFKRRSLSVICVGN